MRLRQIWTINTLLLVHQPEIAVQVQRLFATVVVPLVSDSPPSSVDETDSENLSQLTTSSQTPQRPSTPLRNLLPAAC